MFPLSSVVHCLLPQRTVLNRPVANAEHTHSVAMLYTPSALPDQEDSCRKFPNVTNYLQLFLLLLLTFVQHDSKVLLQQAMNIWCDSNKIYHLKTDHCSFVLFFTFGLGSVCYIYCTSRKKKCLRDMFLFL